MQNTIPITEWFQAVDEEYLSSYIREGGSSVKFAVTPPDMKAHLYATMEARCKELGYEVVKLDAKESAMRAYMPQDIFFGLARQVDWRRLARGLILRLASEREGFRVADIDPDAEGVFDAIAEANRLIPQFVNQRLMPEIQNEVALNSSMARDFRVCMSHLCLEEYKRIDYNGQPLLAWLRGFNNRVSNVRPFSIYTSINRNTARHFIESALYWIRYVGRAGTVILFDNSRVTVPRNPRDGWKYYTRAMTLEHYELLREFIDSVDQLKGTLLVVVTSQDFLDESPLRSSRGYGIYPALQTRVMDDVRDRGRVNPISSLVRLSEEK